MGTVVKLSGYGRKARPDTTEKTGDAEIVIFPGIRIERQSVDLSRRVRDVSRTPGRNPSNRS